jgi:hypothetical protein
VTGHVDHDKITGLHNRSAICLAASVVAPQVGLLRQINHGPSLSHHSFAASQSNLVAVVQASFCASTGVALASKATESARRSRRHSIDLDSLLSTHGIVANALAGQLEARTTVIGTVEGKFMEQTE